MSASSIILLLLLASITLGGWLWWRSVRDPTPKPTAGTPDVYTINNVQLGKHHYIEQGGVVQAFRLLNTHPQSGYFEIEAIPPETEPAKSDRPHIRGWTKEILSSRLIKQEDLLRELPLEMRRIYSF